MTTKWTSPRGANRRAAVGQSCALAGGVLAAMLTAGLANADFLGLSVENITDNDDGLFEYAIYALFDDPNDELLNVFNRNTTSTTGFFHNTIDGANQSPLPYPQGALDISDNPDADSYVTIKLDTGDDNTTSLDPNFCFECFIKGTSLGSDAGWFNSNPPNGQGAAGPEGKVLIAVFTPLNDGDGNPGVVSGTLDMTYISDGSAAFAEDSFTTTPQDCGDRDAGDCCEANGTPACDDAECCNAVCAADPLCCESAWDAQCAEQASRLCAGCDAGCPAEGDCCIAHPTPGCADVACCQSVCGVDPFCCDQEWDEDCAGLAVEICAPLCKAFGACCYEDACADLPVSECVETGGIFQGDGTTCDSVVCPKPDFCPGEGDCCEANGSPGCDERACCDAVCAIDSTCCTQAWDAACAEMAVALCGCPGSDGFLGLVVENITDNDDGLTEYAVYAVFDAPSDTLLNVFNRNTASSTGFFHNSIDGKNQSALPYTTGATEISDNPDADSFVTIGLFTGDGNTTALDPNFCSDCFINGNSLGENSGWFNSNPPNQQGAAGKDGKVLLAVFTPLNDGNGNPGIVSGTLEITYTANGKTTFGSAAFSTGALVVINELDPEQPGDDDAEFVELLNVSGLSVDLGSYELELVDGTSGGADVYQVIELPKLSLGPGERLVLCTNSSTVCDCEIDALVGLIDGGPAAVGLRHLGQLVDSVSYGGDVPGYTEGSGASADDPDAPNLGLSRDPDGIDTDDNSVDFALRCVTPGTTNTASSMLCPPCYDESCGGPRTGDCCVANGTPACDDAACCELVCATEPFCCVIQWDSACAAQASILCLECEGARCSLDGSCEVLNAAACEAAGGLFQGAGTDCVTTRCVEICGGATAGDCCMANGTPGCDDATCCEAVCAVDPVCCTIGWDPACASLAFELCPACQLAGACCFPDASCLDLDPADCAAQGGDFQGTGTSCDAVVCPDPIGACCLPDGTCVDVTLLECKVAGGAYQGDLVPCDQVGCPQPPGACCLFDGTCIEVVEKECPGLGGIFQGPGTTCAKAKCPEFLCGSPDAGDCCIDNGTPACDDTRCCETVCGLDPFCCDTAWDNICADEANDLCKVCGGPPSVCGDPGAGDCCADNGTPGCDDLECCEGVCAVDAFCCDTAWDGLCADAAQADPNCDCGGGGGPCPGEGDCCASNGSPGCDDARCCEIVCAADPFCCDVEWDDLCAEGAAALCDVCEGGTDCPEPLCFGDINADGQVDGADLGLLLGSWGSDDPCTDLDRDGATGEIDLDLLLAAWGACPVAW